MNGLLKITGLVGLVILLSALSLYAQSRPEKHIPGPVVKVSNGGGHGSGFHAGNGDIITAAHVVDGGDKFTVTLDDGSTVPAEVMWANESYDVARLRIKRTDFASSPVNCTVPPKGLAIEASGNPLSFEWLSFRGFVAGKPTKFQHWSEVSIMDISGAPGISGGPVYNDRGEVVGIFVGAALVQLGGMFPSIAGLSIMVPGSAICKVWGRA